MLKLRFFLWKYKTKIIDIFGLLIILFILGGYSFYTYHVYISTFKGDAENGFIINLFAGLCIMLLILLIILWIGINKKASWSIEKIFVISTFFIGLAYMITLPAFSVPDELTHYATSYRISNQLLGIKEDDKAYSICRNIDNCEAITHITTLETYRYINDTLFDGEGPSSGISHTPEKAMTRASVLSHLSQAIGITIARLFHMSYAGLLYMGQLFSLITFVIITYYAIKIIPFGKNVLFAISGLPMVLHEATSFSYDAFIYGLSFLLIAYLMKLIYEIKSITWKNCVLLFIISIILSPCKMIYSFITLLVILVSDKKFYNKNFAHLYKIGLPLVSIVYAVVFNMGEVANTSSGKHIVEWAGEEGYTVSYVLHHIGATIKLYLATAHEQMGFYLDSMLGGSLGWFTVDIPVELTMCSLVLLIISLREKRNYRIKYSQSILYVCMFVFVSLLACTTMLLAWTPLSFPYIAGVQGRYFIPVLPLLMLPFVDAANLQAVRTRKILIIGNTVVNYLVLLRVIEINVVI